MRRARWPFKAPQHRLWQTTELWDFGVAVDIEIPSPQPEEKIRIGEVLEGDRIALASQASLRAPDEISMRGVRVDGPLAFVLDRAPGHSRRRP